MKVFHSTVVLGLGVTALATAGCASAPAAPFDVMKNSTVTAYRLQNYEPPAQAAAAAPTAAAPGMIPGIPPEVQAWAQQALPGLQQLIPPGLLPPGMMPGQAAPPVAQPQEQVPRFIDFRILGQAPVMDPDLKETLGDIFGTEDNYQAQHQGCMYPELGLSFTPPEGGPRYDMLVSFSCNQVNAVSFAWPHKASGMSPDMVKALSEIVPKVFSSSNTWPAAQPAPAQQQPGQAMSGQPMGGQLNVGTPQ